MSFHAEADGLISSMMNILVEFGNSKVVLALTDPAKLDETLLSKFPQLEDKAHKLLIYSHLFEEYVDLESSSDVQDKSRLKIVTLGGGTKAKKERSHLRNLINGIIRSILSRHGLLAATDKHKRDVTTDVYLEIKSEVLKHDPSYREQDLHRDIRQKMSDNRSYMKRKIQSSSSSSSIDGETSDLESVSTAAADDDEDGASDTVMSDTPAVPAARKKRKVKDGTLSDTPRTTGQRKEQGHGSKRAEQGYGSTRAEHGSTNSSSSSDSEPEAAILYGLMYGEGKGKMEATVCIRKDIGAGRSEVVIVMDHLSTPEEKSSRNGNLLLVDRKDLIPLKRLIKKTVAGEAKVSGLWLKSGRDRYKSYRATILLVKPGGPPRYDSPDERKLEITFPPSRYRQWTPIEYLRFNLQ